MNIHYGKRDILGATRIATLTIDQDRVEPTADIVYIIDSLKWRGKHLRWYRRMGGEIMVPICKCDNGIV
jgi:hypothetical protein